MSEYICSLCPRNCCAPREALSGRGFCGAGILPKIARVAPHYWEEPCISGTNGSGTIFFSHCVLSCVFCQNSKISTGGCGKSVSVRQLADYFRLLENEGVHNINLVSPTPYVESIIEALNIYKPSVPVVYNTGGYEKAETIRRLEGIIDIYLPDIKYVSPELSAKYSHAADYYENTIAAVREMVRQTGVPVYDENGIMQRGTLIRHLILPQHTRNSIEVLTKIAEEFGGSIPVSLMGQYVPLGKAADYPDINRKITAREYNKVLDYLYEAGLDGFVQELSSAKKDYVPDFDPDKLP